MFRQCLLFLLLVFGAGAGSAEISRQSLEYGGLKRTYLLYAPARQLTGPRPLVLVLHGGGGSGGEVRESTRRGFDRLAEEHGFYVLYPDAIDRIWDTGHGEISGRLDPRVDDLGFLKTLVEEASREFSIDRSRIFATGVSRGGQASYMLACEAPGLIRAIAPVSMTLPQAQAAACPSRRPVGFLLIMGTADPIVPYYGGRIEIFGRSRDLVLSADRTFRAFQERNGCIGQKDLKTAGAVERLAGTGCAAPVRLDRVNGGGHGWPSGRKILGSNRSGPINTDISAPDEIWSFFSRF